ncbi:MAG: HTH domain-containing protein [Candidatus Nanoarchaeia archaeon]|nr:HTH domain-containing protein [Candidatus Nanoarchaeia archaeon]MDD5357573.1 HTH domain-containing protein [Candidatus Nanoarchaeia archaeon]MDD5588492.1 HTH domain-containing protein [Candidatus Nanoarchaeia archaeon]
MTTTREITLKESKGAFTLFKKDAKDKKGYDFSGISAIKQLLTKEKARMLDVIKNEKPESLYDLAKKLDRSFKAVHDDVKLLERLGFIEITEEKTKNRIRHKPKIITDLVTIHIKI